MHQVISDTDGVYNNFDSVQTTSFVLPMAREGVYQDPRVLIGQPVNVYQGQNEARLRNMQKFGQSVQISFYGQLWLDYRLKVVIVVILFQLLTR